MDTFFFERPDGTLLECVGRRLVKVSTERREGPGARRWHHIQLLTTGEGTYVLAIQYLTFAPGERPVGYAWQDTAENLRRRLMTFKADLHVPCRDTGTARDAAMQAVADDLRERFTQALPVILRHL